MTGERRKLAAILAADIAGYSRLAGAEEERTLARLRGLRTDLIDPAIAVHHGRVVKRTGDGMLVEFRSAVDTLRCAVEMQAGMEERNAGLAPERRIEFRVGIHVGDVVEETDGDLMGDGVNIAARLEGIAEPGGICLSATAHDSVRGKIDAAFADLGEKDLKNIARPVRVYAISPLLVTSPSPPRGGGEGRDEVGDSRARNITSPSLSATRRGEEAAPRLSIVVLPFANIGGDPEQEYFVDGVTESLTTDLSRIGGSFVIGRNTAFTYKGKAVDLKQIGRELNVRYVLEGSVQRGGNRMRVNVQLIDAETGNHLWAERFDKPVADLFDMQDEIVARLANQLGTELVAAEARRAERAPHPDSMDLYLQGMAWFNRGLTPECLARAHDFFERALTLDAGTIETLAGIAFVDALGAVMYDDVAVRATRLAAAEAAAVKALAAAPNHAQAHVSLGFVFLASRRPAQAIAEAERALALDRNLANAHGLIGVAKYVIGRAEETETHVQEALRLSPRDTNAHRWMGTCGVAKLFLGADEESAAWLRRSIEANRNYPFAHFWLAAALALLGRLDEARAAARAGLALDPTFNVRHHRAGSLSANPIFLAQGERVIDGMRKAGVPEG